MLNVNTETVRFIIDKAHEFQMLDVEPEDDSVEARDPAYAELKATIDDLEPDQQVDLITPHVGRTRRLSRRRVERALADARDRWNERTAEYLIETPLLSDYLSEGLDRLGVGD